jgi:arginyl-tRNA synthetase
VFRDSICVLPHKQIELRLQAAVREILPDADVSIVLVRPCPIRNLATTRSNALMSLAKVRKINPRQLATDTLAKLDVSERVRKSGNRRCGLPEFSAEKFRADADTRICRARRTFVF